MMKVLEKHSMIPLATASSNVSNLLWTAQERKDWLERYTLNAHGNEISREIDEKVSNQVSKEEEGLEPKHIVEQCFFVIKGSRESRTPNTRVRNWICLSRDDRSYEGGLLFFLKSFLFNVYCFRHFERVMLFSSSTNRFGSYSLSPDFCSYIEDIAKNYNTKGKILASGQNTFNLLWYLRNEIRKLIYILCGQAMQTHAIFWKCRMDSLVNSDLREPLHNNDECHINDDFQIARRP